MKTDAQAWAIYQRYSINLLPKSKCKLEWQDLLVAYKFIGILYGTWQSIYFIFIYRASSFISLPHTSLPIN